MLIVLSCFSWKAIDVLPDRKYTKLALHDFYDIFSHFHFMLDMTLINSPIYHNLFRIGLTFQATPAWRRSSEGVIFQTITIPSIKREKGSTQALWILKLLVVETYDLGVSSSTWPFLDSNLVRRTSLQIMSIPPWLRYFKIIHHWHCFLPPWLRYLISTHWYKLTLFYLTMTQIGLGLVTVLDHFKVKMWVFWEFDQQESVFDFGSQLYS